MALAFTSTGARAACSGRPAAARAPSAPAATPRCRRAVAGRGAAEDALKGMDPATAEQLKKAMEDPAMQQRMQAMQEAMQRPEVQQQMAQMEAMMRNEEMQKRMAELRKDPELQGMFAEIQKGGMGALMKFWNDPKILAKLGEKLGDVPMPAPGAAAAAAAGPRPAAAPPSAVPDIDNIWDAAKYGDLEAVEDFIAIGKDVSQGDEEARTPLHWAAGMGHSDVASLLLKEGAPLEVADSKGNTPLMYAAGYGRPALVKLLLDAGASPAARNANGKTAADLTADPRNPLNQEAELVQRLKAGA
ncbi:hypothetical protein Rsub_07431 [Raphidocelis subcapitata]|uniref:Uncharacterized protein n=1 Tax=Raphidocelis subcapitata TaxID=307507 RepID=A0A2V0PC63_9CHLO|nr:hypothetical protein Rsub_07431 [Raphidocelis subcapitata]|eukprot:GBF94695.1 hypothetical protein Rsub_07431 [Raphidocelis subcapitata]